MGTDINETGMQGQRMKQGKQGQMEGCQHDGNRMDLRMKRYSRGRWREVDFVRDPLVI